MERGPGGWGVTVCQGSSQGLYPDLSQSYMSRRPSPFVRAGVRSRSVEVNRRRKADNGTHISWTTCTKVHTTLRNPFSLVDFRGVRPRLHLS